MNKGSIRARVLIGLAAIAVVAAACSSSGARPPRARRPRGKCTSALEPGAVGNGWREAMICSAKAQAVKSGNVSSVTVNNRDTDAAGQLADIRDLIAKNVNIILINPSSPDALNPAIEEATRQGHRVVAIDAPVTAPGAYNLSNDQDQYAYLGAKALFEQMGEKGDVIYMRGIAGHPADTDRDTGSRRPSPSTRTSRSPRRPSPSGTRPRPSPRSMTSSPAASSSTASGRRASTTSSSTRSRPRARRSCRSSARTTRASSSSSSTNRASRAPR